MNTIRNYQIIIASIIITVGLALTLVFIPKSGRYSLYRNKDTTIVLDTITGVIYSRTISISDKAGVLESFYIYDLKENAINKFDPIKNQRELFDYLEKMK